MEVYLSFGSSLVAWYTVEADSTSWKCQLASAEAETKKAPATCEATETTSCVCSSYVEMFYSAFHTFTVLSAPQVATMPPLLSAPTKNFASKHFL